ncbi:MAG: histidine phosphatase family protein [Oscillospiraceae bacterium]|nr:histidine phosphatase family protein [Oscillospiraceae bacterium]
MAEPILELELYIVRHGQSMGNAGLMPTENYRALEDSVLTPLGEDQARLLGEFYSRIDFDCILSSGLNRAVQTASEVAKRQVRTHVVESHPLFTECALSEKFGEKSFDEIKKAHPFAVPALGMSEADNFVVAGAPSCDEAHFARATQALNYLRSRFHSGEKVMVVAHAMFNTFFLFSALGLGIQPIFDFSFGNTCVTKLLFFKKGTGRFGADVHLIYHSDHSHLIPNYSDEILKII